MQLSHVVCVALYLATTCLSQSEQLPPLSEEAQNALAKAEEEEQRTVPFPWQYKPDLGAGSNGSSVLVPEAYWMTSLSFNVKYTKPLAAFLEEKMPLNDNTRPWYDYTEMVVQKYEGTPLPYTDRPLAPTINAMSRMHTAFWVSAGFTMQYCEGGPNCDKSVAAQKWPLDWRRGTLAQLSALVDLLANTTMIAKLDSLRISNRPPSDQDRLLAAAADIPLDSAQTLRGQLTRMQYATYQELVRTDAANRDFPTVECGKHSANPCTQYPPAT